MAVNQRSSTSIWSSIAYLSGLGGVTATLVATTQKLAANFGYAPVLGRPLFGHWYNPALGLSWLMKLDTRCLALAHFHRASCAADTHALLNTVHMQAGVDLGATAAATGLFALMGSLETNRRSIRRGRALPKSAPTTQRHNFWLELGTATGQLAQLGHGAAIKAGSTVTLRGDEASQNIIILGGIGSGKTTRAINPIVTQSLQQHSGMLVFNVKGDYDETVLGLAENAKRPVEIVGTRGRACNLLAGLSPELAASFLKSALILAGSANGDAAIWNNVATEYARNALGVLSFVPQYYSLHGLYQFIFSRDFREQLAGRLSDAITVLEDTRVYGESTEKRQAENDLLRLRRYRDYEDTVFHEFDDRVKSSVRFQLSSVLSLFTLPEIERSFCATDAQSINFKQLLDGQVMLIDLPLQKYGLTAKTIYTFLKLQFFSLMDRRRVEPTWNQSRPVVFLCDEYQELVACNKDGLSDLNFWDKSRSSRCVGVISAQGIESFRAAIGDPALTDAFLQNFRQTICFRTEDKATIERIAFLLGQVDVERENISIARSRSSTTGKLSSGKTMSTAINSQQQATINPQFFRQLKEGEAIALLSIAGTSYDDVIRMLPVYVERADYAETAYV